MADATTIEPGDKRTRTQIREVWGGSPQGGIAPSQESQSVLIYSDPSRGEQLGYFDGWTADADGEPVFEYTGHGPTGDQRMWLGNKALRDHAEESRTVRIFVADGTNSKPQLFEYLGEFALDTVTPLYKREVSDGAGGSRMVFVFRLRPSGEFIVEEHHRLPPAPTTKVTTWQSPTPEETGLAKAPTTPATSRPIPTERNRRTRTTRKAMQETEVERLEAELCDRFEAALLAHGHAVCRYEIQPEGDRSLLRTDTFDVSAQVLYEAKSRAARDPIRMAIGQLFDYRRHLNPKPKALAVLLPEAPTTDLRLLLESVGIAVVYEQAGRFEGWPV